MKTRILAILLLLCLSACNGTFDIGIEHPSANTATPAPASSATAVPGDTTVPTLPAPSDTPLPSPTASLLPSDTLLPSVTASPVPSHTPVATPYSPLLGNYVDDRSTPSQVIVSLYNAINRREYLRAYNYWSNPADSQGSFNAYVQGYQETASVDLVFGQISGDAGAGQLYYTVPVLLKATARDGTRTNYAACYVVHQAQPANFGAPPFIPMGIDRGQAKSSDLNASDASALAGACAGFPVGSRSVAVSGGNLSLDKSNYLDSRSGPLEIVSSLLNALNRKEYVRAYSYFQDPANFPGAYDAYAAGYANTDTLTATFGAAQSEGAAGNLYFKLPLALFARTITGATQTFVGCYTLHLAQPANQATPPFQPLGILSGAFQQVANGTDVDPLLPSACQ